LIKRLIELFNTESYTPQPTDTGLAAAVLLIEIVRADHDTTPAELAAAKHAINGLLPDTDADALIKQAQQEASTANDLHRFTSAIHDSWSNDQKSGLLISLWRVAFADGELDKYEEHLIRRIAELLYVPHSEFIRTKLIARDN